MKRSVPILIYHHIAPDREIAPRQFEAQMRSLLDRGYKSLSMDDLVGVVHGYTPLMTPTFALNFDDGYSDNWGHAFPILKEMGLRATIYLVTDKIGTDGFLSWDQIRVMSASGLVTFGSHTRTHRHFFRKEPYKDLGEELLISKAVIEDKLDKACRHLAWPWGDYEDAWLPLVENLGYETAVTTLAGANASGSNPFKLRRINVRRPSIDWLNARLKWNDYAASAGLFGLFYGWDRRLKVWWNDESPYSHG